MKKLLAVAAVLPLLASCDRLETLVQQQPVQNTDAQTKSDEHKKAEMALPDFAQLVEQVGASVVNIRVENESRNQKMDPFAELFRDFMQEDPFNQDDQNAYNYGSGFIISSDGDILTNAHVVRGGGTIIVTLKDKRELRAQLVGIDEDSDTALLSVKADNLSAVKIGHSKSLQVGEWVAAIGAPFGFDNSVTSGIVSAKKRTLPDSNYIPFIQTDVAINPGNSGGPLFNLRGEVVGMNSQIFSRSGGFMGISFSVPIDVSMNVVEQLKKTGHVRRGHLGVMVQPVTHELSQNFKLDRPRGAVIVQITPNGPASKTSLQVGDIILEVNGEIVETSTDLPIIIGYSAPGSTVQLKIWRNASTVDMPVVLDELENKKAISFHEPATSQYQDKAFRLPELGLTLAPLDEKTAQHYKIPNGLMVMNVESQAQTAGFRKGQIIMSVGQTVVSDEASFRAALQAYQGQESVPLFVLINGQPFFLSCPLK
ncbi:MAG: Do family serine endopeptidase [Neisseriaceae bacterium]|nr:Do family serine endopeptidase [Neisseriaceae bacterium]